MATKKKSAKDSILNPDELAEQWKNGNKKFVVESLESTDSLTAARVAIRTYLSLKCEKLNGEYNATRFILALENDFR